ncbi:MAG: sulfatase-like hydrolase/transferase [Deltaproteobacteria bacterium]|nr:sulfatase-like hydrolase/transferase [Deltaproteobacteria bacterium]
MLVFLEISAVAVFALLVAKFVQQPWRGRIFNLLKAWVTIRVFWLLLGHPVTMEDGSRVAAGRLVMDTLTNLDPGTFWTFVALATGIKFIGILASMYRWRLLLFGQSIVLPFRHIFGSFLIGRFIGTFLPSTAGLDGYKLYDAARFSGKTIEVTATTALEKVIGFSGIFLSFLVALPFGIKIFGENARLIAMLTVPFCLGLIAALMLVLWYPGLIQWALEHLPIPGKARLEGLVLRVSHSAAAYRGKRALVIQAFALSFVVHFSTAAMYYFTALAISAENAEFWPIAFGSSIQILATVLSPFTIAGEGIREAAQLVLLGNMIGPDKAIVSAALGFWAAEAMTLFGGIFWWIRKPDYTPAYCLVDGEQVDYAAAAAAAVSLETEQEREARSADVTPPPPFSERLKASAGYGLGAGILSGLLIGVVEAFVIALGGFGNEGQVLWYGPLAYASVLGGMGLVGGAVLAALPMDHDEIRGWVPSLGVIATLIPFGLAITVFRLRRDVFLEQLPPLPVLLGVLGAAGAIALLLFVFGPRLFRGRAGEIVRPSRAIALLMIVVLGGAVTSAAVVGGGPALPEAPAVPAGLENRPNVILIMVDTLRADHLSCYGAKKVRTPAICSLTGDGGHLFNAYSHASWTKPATASLLTSLVPSSHGAMSKPSALSQDIQLIAEVMQERGYATGGIVSNINLAPSFGFDQGYDEYHYLGPDYLAGSEESSSKLILYQIARSVWFKLKPGLRVGDFYQDSGTVNMAAFDYLDRHADSRFFLFLHYMDPHDPYFAHPYDGQGIARVSNQHPDPERAAEMHHLYEGEIEFLDANIAKLIAKLRALGVYDDSVIALTSDHGEEFYEHGGWWHGLTLYDEQIHVPLVVKWANAQRASIPDARNHIARLIDVSPTLIAQTGAAIPEAMQGLDLVRGFAGRSEKDRVAFSEEDHEGNVLRSLRSMDWKLIEANEGNPRGLASAELFDIVRDPGETENRIAEQTAVAGELRARADANEQFAKSTAAEGGESTLSSAEEEALRALGYIE